MFFKSKDLESIKILIRNLKLDHSDTSNEVKQISVNTKDTANVLAQVCEKLSQLEKKLEEMQKKIDEGKNAPKKTIGRPRKYNKTAKTDSKPGKKSNSGAKSS